jgi:hypothetical protein
MNSRLDKLISDSSNEFDDWIKILNKYRASLFTERKQNDEESTDLLYETADVLSKIVDIAIRFSNCKDDFDTSKMYLNLYGPCLIIKSNKTNQTIYLATDLEGIYLETSFLHAENLKNMGDDFWLEFFELKKFSGFEYLENSYFPNDVQRKYPELFHSYKNTLFLMFRKFFLSHAENYEDIDLGNFKVLWKTDTDFLKMIEETCLAFRIMYRMNFKLWKISELQNK